MTDQGITRRKALAAVAGTGVAAAFGGAGTYAALSDRNTATLELTSGSIVLKIQPSETQRLDPPDEWAASQGEPVEYRAEWTLSNAGTLNAASLSLAGVTCRVAETGEADPEQVLRAARVVTFDYAGADRSDDHASLRSLRDGGAVPLSSTPPGDPELPAFERTTRTLRLGVRFDYARVSGDGGFAVTVEPSFRAAQAGGAGDPTANESGDGAASPSGATPDEDET